jgi:hypothetical protein
MKGKKVENLPGDRKRETKTWDDGSKTITTWKQGHVFRKIESVERRNPPKK